MLCGLSRLWLVSVAVWVATPDSGGSNGRFCGPDGRSRGRDGRWSGRFVSAGGRSVFKKRPLLFARGRYERPLSVARCILRWIGSTGPSVGAAPPSRVRSHGPTDRSYGTIGRSRSPFTGAEARARLRPHHTMTCGDVGGRVTAWGSSHRVWGSKVPHKGQLAAPQAPL